MKLSPDFEPMPFNTRTPRNDQAVVVGIYGVPGCGKTYLLRQLKQLLQQESFTFHDGSEVIANIVPGGLDAFQKQNEQEQMHWRGVAIDRIKQECVESGRTAVVAGHLMLWPEEEEKSQLVQLCREHGILLSIMPPLPALPDFVSALLRDFRHHTEGDNLRKAELALDGAIAAGSGSLNTLLVLDADRTLTAEDTGALFWEKLRLSRHTAKEQCPLKALFSSKLAYTHTAFRQAVLLYEEATNDQEYNAICQDVASTVIIHPEFVSLLQMQAGHNHVGAVVISCGLRRVWEIVLERAGLSQTVGVIAGGRISDGYVVTETVKAALVARSQQIHKLYVWAFGDSPLDMAMLRTADRAVVVSGDEGSRSKSMDAALQDAIENHKLSAHQALLPSYASPRLSTDKLPLIELTDGDFIAAVFGTSHSRAPPQILHMTDRHAAKMLMTPMRDATVSGPSLRVAHVQAGRFLAHHLVAEMIGIEEYPIPHVQGHNTSGFRLLHERQTLIVALMRGGEPMAFGVNDAFPLAMFLHASCPEDITRDSVRGRLTVILVDSVVNSGKTVLQFVQYIRSLHATIRIVIVAGVVQAQCMSQGLEPLCGDVQLNLVALRLSDNKFTGSGTTDTGNRLYNTTHLA
ncbi:hypothetical protein BU24DRAFT_444083 [Aaosphaeria arxii CBS 175.79]|uniref:Phosphoribosyltransferase domain-containing protein n=1 Tax=Aaosphaeria arxii CBS 175.79 TaxID=1450172 RepID=A0A6A5XCY3_9PLEO|nr:uncharacterized protein BU24DRAFT_444083 [Aaosphaeria arxii CBS 175.79]KAF2010838.1 hypothetical protein BU24DRAFT_444083 [Aaosphaeria arxii CBS 175.79]